MISAKSILVLMMAAVGTGCIPFGDPEGPGASGDITLGKSVDASGFKTFKMIAIVDEGAPFDPAHPVFTRSVSEPAASWLSLNDDLKTTTFPHAYSIGKGLGTTEVEHWRVLAWLSAQEDPITLVDDGFTPVVNPFPASGEPWGTATFDVDSCGAYGDFCGVTDGVSFALDKIAP